MRKSADRESGRRSSTVSGEQLDVVFLPTAETILHKAAVTEFRGRFPAFHPPKYDAIKATIKSMFEYDVGYLCYMVEPEYMLDKQVRLNAAENRDDLDTIHSDAEFKEVLRVWNKNKGKRLHRSYREAFLKVKEQLSHADPKQQLEGVCKLLELSVPLANHKYMQNDTSLLFALVSILKKRRVEGHLTNMEARLVEATSRVIWRVCDMSPATATTFVQLGSLPALIDGAEQTAGETLQSVLRALVSISLCCAGGHSNTIQKSSGSLTPNSRARKTGDALSIDISMLCSERFASLLMRLLSQAFDGFSKKGEADLKPCLLPLQILNNVFAALDKRDGKKQTKIKDISVHRTADVLNLMKQALSRAIISHYHIPAGESSLSSASESDSAEAAEGSDGKHNPTPLRGFELLVQIAKVSRAVDRLPVRLGSLAALCWLARTQLAEAQAVASASASDTSTSKQVTFTSTPVLAQSPPSAKGKRSRRISDFGMSGTHMAVIGTDAVLLGREHLRNMQQEICNMLQEALEHFEEQELVHEEKGKEILQSIMCYAAGILWSTTRMCKQEQEQGHESAEADTGNSAFKPTEELLQMLLHMSLTHRQGVRRVLAIIASSLLAEWAMNDQHKLTLLTCGGKKGAEGSDEETHLFVHDSMRLLRSKFAPCRVYGAQLLLGLVHASSPQQQQQHQKEHAHVAEVAEGAERQRLQVASSALESGMAVVWGCVSHLNVRRAISVVLRDAVLRAKPHTSLQERAMAAYMHLHHLSAVLHAKDTVPSRRHHTCHEQPSDLSHLKDAVMCAEYGGRKMLPFSVMTLWMMARNPTNRKLLARRINLGLAKAKTMKRSLMSQAIAQASPNVAGLAAFNATKTPPRLQKQPSGKKLNDGHNRNLDLVSILCRHCMWLRTSDAPDLAELKVYLTGVLWLLCYESTARTTLLQYSGCEDTGQQQHSGVMLDFFVEALFLAHQAAVDRGEQATVSQDQWTVATLDSVLGALFIGAIDGGSGAEDSDMSHPLHRELALSSWGDVHDSLASFDETERIAAHSKETATSNSLAEVAEGEEDRHLSVSASTHDQHPPDRHPPVAADRTLLLSLIDLSTSSTLVLPLRTRFRAAKFVQQCVFGPVLRPESEAYDEIDEHIAEHYGMHNSLRFGSSSTEPSFGKTSSPRKASINFHKSTLTSSVSPRPPAHRRSSANSGSNSRAPGMHLDPRMVDHCSDGVSAMVQSAGALLDSAAMAILNPSVLDTDAAFEVHSPLYATREHARAQAYYHVGVSLLYAAEVLAVLSGAPSKRKAITQLYVETDANQKRCPGGVGTMLQLCALFETENMEDEKILQEDGDGTGAATIDSDSDSLSDSDSDSDLGSEAGAQQSAAPPAPPQSNTAKGDMDCTSSDPHAPWKWHWTDPKATRVVVLCLTALINIACMKEQQVLIGKLALPVIVRLARCTTPSMSEVQVKASGILHNLKNHYSNVTSLYKTLLRIGAQDRVDSGEGVEQEDVGGTGGAITGKGDEIRAAENSRRKMGKQASGSKAEFQDWLSDTFKDGRDAVQATKSQQDVERRKKQAHKIMKLPQLKASDSGKAKSTTTTVKGKGRGKGGGILSGEQDVVLPPLGSSRSTPPVAKSGTSTTTSRGRTKRAKPLHQQLRAAMHVNMGIVSIDKCRSAYTETPGLDTEKTPWDPEVKASYLATMGTRVVVGPVPRTFRFAPMTGAGRLNMPVGLSASEKRAQFPQLSKFRHVEGCTCCKDLFDHFTEADGTIVHYYKYGGQLEQVSGLVNDPPAPPLTLDLLGVRSLPAPLEAPPLDAQNAMLPPPTSHAHPLPVPSEHRLPHHTVGVWGELPDKTALVLNFTEKHEEHRANLLPLGAPTIPCHDCGKPATCMCKHRLCGKPTCDDCSCEQHTQNQLRHHDAVCNVCFGTAHVRCAHSQCENLGTVCHDCYSRLHAPEHVPETWADIEKKRRADGGSADSKPHTCYRCGNKAELLCRHRQCFLSGHSVACKYCNDVNHNGWTVEKHTRVFSRREKDVGGFHNHEKVVQTTFQNDWRRTVYKEKFVGLVHQAMASAKLIDEATSAFADNAAEPVNESPKAHAVQGSTNNDKREMALALAARKLKQMARTKQSSADQQLTRNPGMLSRVNAVKMVLGKYHIYLCRIFRYYCATGGGNDVVTMNQNAWAEFYHDVRVAGGEDNVHTNIGALDTIFIASNLQQMEKTAEQKFNSKNALHRFEFMEALTRLAVARYIKSEMNDEGVTDEDRAWVMQGREAGQQGQEAARALQLLFLRNVLPGCVLTNCESLHHAYRWRDGRLYNEEVDHLLAENSDLLMNIFERYSPKHIKKKRYNEREMNIDDWQRLLTDAGLMNTEFTYSQMKLCFVCAKSFNTDEFKKDDVQHLLFHDFTEALCRVAEKIGLPTMQQLQNAGVDNSVEFFELMQRSETNGSGEKLEVTVPPPLKQDVEMVGAVEEMVAKTNDELQVPATDSLFAGKAEEWVADAKQFWDSKQQSLYDRLHAFLPLLYYRLTSTKLTGNGKLPAASHVFVKRMEKGEGVMRRRASVVNHIQLSEEELEALTNEGASDGMETTKHLNINNRAI